MHYRTALPRQTFLFKTKSYIYLYIKTSLVYLNRWSRKVDTESDWQSEFLPYAQRGFILGQEEGNQTHGKLIKM